MTVTCPSETRAKAGWGELAVELVAGQSAATSAEAHSPLKLLAPRPRGLSVWAYLSNFGGGLLPGDRLDFNLRIGAGARCFLGTQASTKIYRSGEKGAVQNHLAANVGPKGILVYAPDVAQSFATSIYRQNQTFHLADSTSKLIFLDWYSSGRSARGERWQFSEYTSRAEIRVGEKLVFLDSIHLEKGVLIDLPSRMGRINCAATLVIIGHGTSLLDELASAPISKRTDLLVVGSAIPGGVVLRFAGVSVEIVAREIFRRLRFVNEWLGDDPFLRKW
jgi:urease accessory protein